MKLLEKIVIVLTVIFTASTVICGTYIAQLEIIEQSNIAFHMGLAFLSISSSFATIAMFARKSSQALDR